MAVVVCFMTLEVLWQVLIPDWTILLHLGPGVCFKKPRSLMVTSCYNLYWKYYIIQKIYYKGKICFVRKDLIFYWSITTLTYYYSYYFRFEFLLECNDWSCVLYAVYFKLFVLFGFTAYWKSVQQTSLCVCLCVCEVFLVCVCEWT